MCLRLAMHFATVRMLGEPAGSCQPPSFIPSWLEAGSEKHSLSLMECTGFLASYYNFSLQGDHRSSQFTDWTLTYSQNTRQDPRHWELHVRYQVTFVDGEGAKASSSKASSYLMDRLSVFPRFYCNENQCFLRVGRCSEHRIQLT